MERDQNEILWQAALARRIMQQLLEVLRFIVLGVEETIKIMRPPATLKMWFFRLVLDMLAIWCHNK